MGAYESRGKPGGRGFGGSRFGLAGEKPGSAISARDVVAGPPPRRNAIALAKDALKLADLQLQLLISDVCQFWVGARVSIALLIAAAATMLAAVPVGLFGIAEYLRRALEIPLELSLLIVAGMTICAAAALIVWSFRRLTLAMSHMQSTADELRENLRWMRSLLNDDR
jgi:hypothetical protein